MELIHLEKVKDGKYLKNYELEYENKSGKIKKYACVSIKYAREGNFEPFYSF